MRPPKGMTIVVKGIDPKDARSLLCEIHLTRWAAFKLFLGMLFSRKP